MVENSVAIGAAAEAPMAYVKQIRLLDERPAATYQAQAQTDDRPCSHEGVTPAGRPVDVFRLDRRDMDPIAGSELIRLA